MRFLPALALLLLVTSFGCQKDGSAIAAAPRTEATLPNGWKEITTAGMSLAFPPTWKPIDLTASSLDKGGDSAFGNDPKFAPMREQARALATQGSFKVFVFDTNAIAKGFGTNCNVSETELPAGTTLETIVAQTKAGLAASVAPGTEVKADYVNLKAGRFAVLHTQIKPAAGPTLQSLAYLTIHDSKMVGVTFTCPTTQLDEVTKIAGQTMDSFHFAG